MIFSKETNSWCNCRQTLQAKKEKFVTWKQISTLEAFFFSSTTKIEDKSWFSNGQHQFWRHRHQTRCWLYFSRCHLLHRHFGSDAHRVNNIFFTAAKCFLDSNILDNWGECNSHYTGPSIISTSARFLKSLTSSSSAPARRKRRMKFSSLVTKI